MVLLALDFFYESKSVCMSEKSNNTFNKRSRNDIRSASRNRIDTACDTSVDYEIISNYGYESNTMLRLRRYRILRNPRARRGFIPFVSTKLLLTEKIVDKSPNLKSF